MVTNKKKTKTKTSYLQPKDCLIPLKISPKDLPIIHIRKKETAPLILVKTALAKGIVISENSRYRLK